MKPDTDSAIGHSADKYARTDEIMEHDENARADAPLAASARWISKVETVKNNPKLRAMEEEIRRLEQRRER